MYKPISDKVEKFINSSPKHFVESGFKQHINAFIKKEYQPHSMIL